MPAAKVAITMDQALVQRVDRFVAQRRFPNRSKFVQEAVREQLQRLDRSRLARESAKLDPKVEQQLADEGLAEGISPWPEY